MGLVEEVNEQCPEAADEDDDGEWQDHAERGVNTETAAVDAGPFPQMFHHAVHDAASLTPVPHVIITTMIAQADR